MRRAVLTAFVLISLMSCGSERRTAPPTRTPSFGLTTVDETPSALSSARASFVRAVNEACREYAERDEALEEPEELDGYVAFMRFFIENSADLDERLAELDPPDEIDGFDDYVAGNRRQTDILRAAMPKVEAAVADDDQAEADDVIDGAIDDFNEIVDELDPYARRYGFTECASDPEDEA